MKVKQLTEGQERSFAVVFDTGEEAADGLLAFARKHHVDAGHFSGIGAFSDVVLGFFDLDRRDYQHIPLKDQVEIVSLLGNFAMQGDEYKLHPHIVVARRDGVAYGGHLIEGHVRPTLEVVVTDAPAHLRRRTDPATGLPLLSP